jgi:hypothetical protein
MAASTARAYRDSDRAKSSNFALPSLVESSNWPPAYRLLLLEMLEKNRFGTELFRSTRNLSIALGLHYRTVQRMLDRLEHGHKFGRKHVRRCEGVLELVLEANSRPNGKLRRQRTYRLRAVNLHPRPTEHDLEESSRGAVCPLPPRPERPLPPAPAPQPKSEPQHRSSTREAEGSGRSLTTRQRKELASRIEVYERGNTGVTESLGGGYTCDLQPGDPRYVKPLPQVAAILAACKSMAQGDEARGLESHGVAMNKAVEAAIEMGYVLPKGGT